MSWSCSTVHQHLVLLQAILDFTYCRPCVAGFVAFFIAQSAKVVTHWYSEGRWDFTRVIGSGGMPSSHTACVSKLRFDATRLASKDRQVHYCCNAGCWPYYCPRHYIRHRYWHICHWIGTVTSGKCIMRLHAALPLGACLSLQSLAVILLPACVAKEQEHAKHKDSALLALEDFYGAGHV